MSKLGHRVGLLDTDIYGPSIPNMMKLQTLKPLLSEGKKMIPLLNYGIRCMSIGFITPPDKALVWSGMMVKPYEIVV